MTSSLYRTLAAAFATSIALASLPARAAEFPTAVPATIKQKYASLYQQNVQVQPNGVRRFDRALHMKREGINVLYLHGDLFEMAYQHGRLLRDEALAGALPEAALMLDKNVRNAVPNIPFVTDLAVGQLYKRISERMILHSLDTIGGNPDDLLLDAYGIADGIGLPLAKTLYAGTGPESLQVLVGLDNWGDIVGSLFEGAAVDSPSQCSAFAAWGEATAGGEMIIGRNTDYPLNGRFDRHPTLIYFAPTNGMQKYMAATSAGIHNAGVLGYNESGIYLGVHTVPTSEVSGDGVPVFMLAQRVLRNARNFDEAVRLFQEFKPASGWTYLLVSTRERRAASIEVSNQQVAIHPASGDAHVQTNHYRTAELAPKYFHINKSVDDDTVARLQRLESLLGQSRGQLDERRAMAILGDKVDALTGRLRSHGNTVAVHTTMTSVVLKPDSHKLFMANGTAPVSQTKYVEFPLIEAFDPTTFASQPYAVHDNSAFSRQNPALAEAEQLFIAAKIAYEIDRNAARAQALMLQVVEKDPGNVGYRFVLGVLALRNNDDDTATAALQKLVTLGDRHGYFLGRYYLGRIKAAAQDAEGAKREFDAVLSEASDEEEQKLRAAAQTALTAVERDGYYALPRQRLVLMMQQADMVTY